MYIDLLKEYRTNPYLWYHMNPITVMRRYKLSHQEQLELYSLYAKNKRMLFTTAIYRSSLYTEKLTNIGLSIGWIVNLIGIICPVTDAAISDSILILLTGIGNLVAIIISTFLKYLSINDQLHTYRVSELLYMRLFNKIEFCMGFQHSYIDEEEHKKKREEFCLKIDSEITDIAGICSSVPNNVIEYHYGQLYIIQLNIDAIDKLIESLLKKYNYEISLQIP